MKRLLRAAAALVCALGLAGGVAFAQTTTVTATHLRMGGYDIASGLVAFVPVDTLGRPIAFADGTGAQNGPTAFQCSVTSGAITGQVQEDGSVSGTCAVPDAALTTPANILYQIQVTDTSTGKRTSGLHYVLQSVAGVTGATWALDHYGPPAQTTNVQLAAIVFFTGSPTGSCADGQFGLDRSSHEVYACFDGAWARTPAASASDLIAGTLFHSTQDAAGVSSSQFLTTANPPNAGMENFAMGVGAAANLYTGSAATNFGGQLDVVLGYNACAACTTAREGVYIGAFAGAHLTGGTSGTGNSPEDDINIAIGSDAMANVTSAGQNIVIGQKAAVTATTLVGNVIEGIHAATNTGSLSANLIAGNYAMDGWTGTAERNTIFGSNILQGSTSNADMQDNVLVGYSIGGNNWAAALRNVIAGSQAATSVTTASDNVLLGYQASDALTTGTANVLIGSQSGQNISTGSGNFLVSAGGQAGNGITTGSNNVCLEYQACNKVITGSNNVMIGQSAGQAGGDVSDSILIGTNAGWQASVSATIIGYAAGYYITSGQHNTAVGDHALFYTSTESGNVGVGYQADTNGGVSSSVELGTGNCTTSSTLCFAGAPVASATGFAVGSVASAALASAATIAPTNAIQHVSGTAAITTITPPAPMASTVGGCLVLISDAAWTTATSGNIATAITAVAGTPYNACYDGAKWYIK